MAVRVSNRLNSLLIALHEDPETSKDPPKATDPCGREARAKGCKFLRVPGCGCRTVLAPEAERMGCKGLSFDINAGWDLTKARTQHEVDRMLDRADPELLVVCIPCKHWGGWHRLNQVYLSPVERARLGRSTQRASKQGLQWPNATSS